MGNVERIASISFVLIVTILMTLSVYLKNGAAVGAMFLLVFLYFIYVQRKQEAKHNTNISKVINEFINYQDDSLAITKKQSKREDAVIIFVFILCLAVGIAVALSVDPYEALNVQCVFSC